MARYTIEVRSSEGDTVRAEYWHAPSLDNVSPPLLADVTPQHLRDVLKHDVLGLGGPLQDRKFLQRRVVELEQQLELPEGWPHAS